MDTEIILKLQQEWMCPSVIINNIYKREYYRILASSNAVIITLYFQHIDLLVSFFVLCYEFMMVDFMVYVRTVNMYESGLDVASFPLQIHSRRRQLTAKFYVPRP